MSYNTDALFWFEKTEEGCDIDRFLKAADPTITEIEIPEEIDGAPVARVRARAFEFAEHLKSVRLPKGLKGIGWLAFRRCRELERVEIAGSPAIELNAFCDCPKLPPETIVMGLVRSTIIITPIYKVDMPEITAINPDYFRPDVFELLIKNNCFRECDLESVLRGMIDHNNPTLFPIAEQCGMLESAGLIDTLTEYSARQGKTEIAAYLLELKKRKFGFNG